MDDMSELEYWQKTAKLYESQIESLKESLKAAHDLNNTYIDMQMNGQLSASDAQNQLNNYISRLDALKKIVLASMSAARNNQHDAEQINAPNAGYLAGKAAAIAEFAGLLLKAIDTSDPLPMPRDNRQN